MSTDPWITDLAAKLSANPAETTGFAFGYLDEAVRGYLGGTYSKADLAKHQTRLHAALQLVERT